MMMMTTNMIVKVDDYDDDGCKEDSNNDDDDYDDNSGSHDDSDDDDYDDDSDSGGDKMFNNADIDNCPVIVYFVQVAYFGTPTRVYSFMVDSYRNSYLAKSLNLECKNPAGLLE